jgi:hypothetical protein
MLVAGSLVAAALCSSSVQADTVEERCAMFAQLSESIARAHQNEVSLAALLGKVKESSMDADAQALVQKLAVLIYRAPRYRVPENQQHFIDETRDRAHVDCLSGQ